MSGTERPARQGDEARRITVAAISRYNYVATDRQPHVVSGLRSPKHFLILTRHNGVAPVSRTRNAS